MNGETVVRCVLFADVAGSTALYERLGDVDARARVARTLALVRSEVEVADGRWIKELGDGALAVFEDANSALEAAHRARIELALRRELLCPMRFGLHAGPLLASSDDVHGDVVNVAARVMALAKPGEVLLTGAVLDALDDEWRGATRALDVLELDGRAQPVAVHELLHGAERRTSPAEALPRAEEARLVLRHADEVVELDRRRPRITIGRDPECELRVDHERVSRRHADVELVRGRFVLTDTSFNGTWVRPEGAREFAVRRDQIVLHGRGSIRVGEPSGPEVEYEVG